MSLDVVTELQQSEAERRTGVLTVGDGTFHLADGTITHAGCRRTIGLDRLVVAADVATAEDWEHAVTADPGAILERPRLGVLALLSVFDAAYLLLSCPGIPDFRPAPAHWLAPVCQVPPHVVIHEYVRRSGAETGPWPAELVDRVPVVAVRRMLRHRTVLTGGQAQVLGAADARRSIAAIARDLGRTTYGCLLAVRELTAFGLVEEPTAATTSVRLPTSPATVAGPAANAVPVGGTVRTAGAAPVTETLPATRMPPAAVALPRRRPRRDGAAPNPDSWNPVDRDLLVRLRAALEELA
jgi:hypothetical protein